MTLSPPRPNIAPSPLVRTKPLLKPRHLTLLLVLGDILGLLICTVVVYQIRLDQPFNFFNPVPYFFFILILTGLYLTDTYTPDTQALGLRAPARVLVSNAIAAIIIAACIYLSGTWGKTSFVGRGMWLPTLLLFSPWAVLLRISAADWLRTHARQSHWLLLGFDDSAKQFWQDFQAHNPLVQLTILMMEGFTLTPDDDFDYLGTLDDLPTWSSDAWSGVVVAPHLAFDHAQVQRLMQMRLQGIPIYKLPDFYETFWYKVPPNLLQDAWFTFSTGFNLFQDLITSRIKRIFDLTVTLFLLVLLSPVMALAAIAIKLDSPGNVFYSQLRTGLNRKPFRVYKFRSMFQDAEKRGVQWASQRDSRITRVGRFIRLMRIDELPQLWNVLRGDMSLIGPRPERPEFDLKLAAVIPYYNIRYLVKPGITGWAQVMYPYGASVEDAYEKLAYDLYYIKNYSLWLEIAIAFKTIRVVLLGKGR